MYISPASDRCFSALWLQQEMMFQKLFNRIVQPKAGVPAERPAALAAEIDVDVVARNDEMSGWFNHETGEILPGFGASGSDTVLDVGCGDSPRSMFLGAKAGVIILADLLPQNVEAAAAKLRATGAREVRTIVGDSNPLPIESASVTRIIASEVLEHVPDPEQFVAELVRVGRPGALYLFSVPHESSERAQQSIAAPAYFEAPNHVRVFDEEAFARLIEKAGLVIERRMRYGFYWTIWWCFFWACKQDLSPPWHPLLDSWTRTWGLLLSTGQGGQIQAALDNALPKSQIIIARKP